MTVTDPTNALSYLDSMPKVMSPNHDHSSTSSAPNASSTPHDDPLSKPLVRVARQSPHRQFLKIFIVGYTALQMVNAIGVLLRARKTTRSLRRALQIFIRALLKPNRASLRSCTFLAGFPTLYRLIIRQSLNHSRNQNLDGKQKLSLLATSLPIILLAPLANLLPDPIITQLNLYILCAAGMACATVLDARVRRGIAKWEAQGEGSARGDLVGKGKGYVPYFMERDHSGIGTAEDRHFGFLDRQAQTKATTFESAKRAISAGSLSAVKACWGALSSGGGWWLFPLTQGLLLDTFVFEGDCFPGSYRNVIVSRSKRYLPTAENLGLPIGLTLASAIPPPKTLLSLLPLFTHAPLPHPAFPLEETTSATSLLASHLLSTQYAPFLPLMAFAKPGHTRAICATLHPMEPSCVRNFAGSVRESMGSAFALVGGYSGVMMLARFKTLKNDPRAAFVKWLAGSIRGAGFVTLSISNAWAWICIFQRLLNPGTMTRSRFGLGGMLAGLWIFLVPSARRLELGLYSVRLSMITLWKIGTKKGWWKARSRLGFAPFALSLAILVHLKRRKLAPMQGWVGKGVTWLDADWERTQEAKSGSERD